MRKTKALISILCAAAVSLTCSCGSKPIVRSQNQQTVITLSWWGNDTRNDYTIEGMQQFQELHPDIQVRCNYSEWSGYESRNRIRMISDTEEDVMQINYSWLSQYSPDGLGYYDLDSLSQYIDFSNFTKDMLEYGRVNGVLNAIPIAMNTMTIYINKTVYEKYGLDVPKTWDDLFKAAEKMSNDGVYPMSAASKSMWLLAIAYAEQISGKVILSHDGELNFSKDDVKTMLNFYCDLVNKKVVPQVEYYDRLNINSGKYAGTVAWVSDAVNYCQSAIDSGYDIIASDYLCTEKTAPGEGWYAKPATLYAISKNTEHPEKAAQLMNYMLNSKDMAVLQGVEKGIPLSSSARKHLEDADMLNGIQYDASLKMEENDNLRKMNPILENSSVIDAFIDSCNLVIYQKDSIDNACDSFYTVLCEHVK
ncbi:MAG: carbohydrate ABC transporter substrate-binding protein [Ruminococcus sp.]|nr:carbohydrate ABC transporter substrate-binding protein [Ruminococcus sp.]